MRYDGGSHPTPDTRPHGRVGLIGAVNQEHEHVSHGSSEGWVIGVGPRGRFRALVVVGGVGDQLGDQVVAWVKLPLRMTVGRRIEKTSSTAEVSTRGNV